MKLLKSMPKVETLPESNYSVQENVPNYMTSRLNSIIKLTRECMRPSVSDVEVGYPEHIGWNRPTSKI